MSRNPRKSRWLIAGWLLAAAIQAHGQTPAGNTALIVSGEEGDPTTRGGSYYYTPADGTFSVSKSQNPMEDMIDVFFLGNHGETWSLDFRALNGQLFEVAVYQFCQACPFGDNTGEFDIGGFGIGCSPPFSASFTIHELVRNLDGVIDSFHISFQQSCIDSPAAVLAGEVYYNSSHQLPPRPVPAPTAKPGELSVYTVTVSPRQIMEGEDATFTFTAKPAPAARGGVLITERLIGPPIPGSFDATTEVEFAPGVTTRHIKLHTTATGQTGKNSQWRVSIVRSPVYKIGAPGAAVVTVARPHRHKSRP